ncbi:MAG: O-antigen ligase family protein [Patescibacteria group bacterium]|jgi:hypothetical protein
MNERLTVIRQTFRAAVPLLVLAEILSFCGLLLPPFADSGFFIIIGLVAVLALLRPGLAFLILLAELFIGSQGGYLFSFGAGSGLYVSLRIGLFLVVFGAWLARTVATLVRRRGDLKSLEWLTDMRRAGLFWPYLALLAVFAASAVNGILRGNQFDDVFFDANGYAYFALFPLFIEQLRDRELPARIAGLLAAAVTTSIIKALAVLYFFSHRIFVVASPLYTWVRDTRVGEITIMTGDFYRIFFQSFVFSLAAIFGLLLFAAAAGKEKDSGRTESLILGVFAATGLVMSLSRSFWFGGFVAVIALAILLARLRLPTAFWKRLALISAGTAIAAVALIVAVYSIPFPRKGADVAWASFLGGRAFSVSGEAAANSRWVLLPELMKAGLRHPFAGSGFGTTVTYTTSDPRLLSTNPTGAYTTFAFEWGYHDLWIKFGLLGLAVYGWWLWRIMRLLAAPLDRTVQEAVPDEVQQKTALLAVALLTAMAAILATNVFSPYLNHPLGIGILMLLAGFGAQNSQKSISADAEIRPEIL